MRFPMVGAVFVSLGISLFAQAAAETPLFPPPPELPSRRGLSPADTHKTIRLRHEALVKWQTSLTPEQKAAWLKAQGMADSAAPRRRGSRGLPTAENGYDWRVCGVMAGLSEAELTQLNKDKMLLENVALAQPFEAYTMPANPVFITSDSILNAFHVLFEDSFRQLEIQRAAQLRRHLEKLLTGVDAEVNDTRNKVKLSDLAPGIRQAQLVLGPALSLLGGDLGGLPADVREEVDRQVARIQAADTAELPAWLGPPAPGLLAIDYRDCRPIGFYAENQRLGDYYRAVRWLQLVPFRAERDAELTGIGLLAGAVWRDYGSGAREFFNAYSEFLGRPDDPGLDRAGYELQNFLSDGNAGTWAETLVDRRRWLLRDMIKGGRDEWARLRNTHQLPDGGKDALAKIQFRVLPAFRLPDSLALQGTGEPGRLPPGLVVAALLGSDFAKQQLKAVVPTDRLVAALKAAREDWHPPWNPERSSQAPSLYDRYLEVLATLSAAPEPEAPAFMRSEAWTAKSCQTIMGGWAQMRHTFTLQAKDTKNYFGLVDTPPGFVEPNPEFFSRLAELIERTGQLLEDGEAFQPSALEEGENLRAAADAIEQTGFHRPRAQLKDRVKLSSKEMERYIASMEAIKPVLAAEHLALEKNATDAEFQSFHLRLLATVRTYADDYISGRRNVVQTASETRLRWTTLESVVHRLESLAHKQLRHQPWTDAEAAFIRSYGEKIALVSGYFGNSWLTPRDDAPRWSTVASDPATSTRLAVAVGRAHLIHVLYPWNGTEVLCTGSVMSYYEYSSQKLLSDKEWKSVLDSASAPAIPAWIAPYIAK